MSLLLHRQRVDVLHALALVAGGREPLPEGLERLAAEDPLLAPWAGRLAPPLRAGEPLPETLRRARLLDADEAAALATEADPAAALARIAGEAAAPPRGLATVRWLPLALVLVGAGGCALGMLATLPLQGLVEELGLRRPDPAASLLSLLYVGAALATTLALLARIRGLRHLLHLWCPAVHRAAAWRDFVRAVAQGDAPLPLPAALAPLAACRLTARRSAAPGWDLPWRTWYMLSRFRLGRALRRRLAAEPSGAARLALLGGADPAEVDAELARALGQARPLLLAALWMTALAGVLIGVVTGPLSGVLGLVEQLGAL